MSAGGQPWQHVLTRGLGALATWLVAAFPAAAQDLSFSGKPIYIESQEIEDERKRDNWSGQIGLGVAFGPEYLGASNHQFRSALDIKFNYKDRIFLENNKIGAVLYNSRFVRAGVLARWNLGRNSDLMIDSATDAVDVDDAFEIGAFAGGSLYKFFLTAELYQGLNSVHKGLSFELEGGYTYEVNSRFKLTPIIGATWASKGFTRAFFGVEPGDSRFEAFNPTGGLYDTFTEVAGEYRLGKNWLAKGTLRYSRLRGQAAKSPIVQNGSKDQLSTFIGIVWLF